MSPGRDPVERALADLAAGRAVVVVDDEDRENEGDIIFAASAATPELVAFTVRHTSGVLCVPMEGADLDRLAIGPMTADNRDAMRTAFCVTVDAAAGITTGISAEDRTHTIRLLADSSTGPNDVVRPGHVFPLRYRPGGVLVRRGHTEAAVDLVRLAGLPPVGVLAELVEDDGSMMRGDALRRFAGEHDLALITVEDLVRHRRRHEPLVERVAQTRIPTRHGDFRAVGYRCTVDGSEHVALVRGEPGAKDGAGAPGTPGATGGEPLVRLHSECLTGDAFGSLRCDCGPQLDRALAAVAADGTGVVVYLRGHEGRGIGLLAKLSAYALQDTGHDTVEANLALGLPVDARDYWIGAQILADLGVERMRLLTNNPAKRAGLEAYGLTVTATTPLTITPNGDNARYLATKRDRLGHALPAEAGVLRQTTGRAS
ncbi:bifunctional 3,4-dihydroxy-2-butanone-4-phosphate synthase/GTP cyclohydrolase II [Actinopolymorpha sp. NPDC004070]|uniref:bifunctional 3,4-dihydroxy-2-butanone-4-phosphate synthase/GTP cyclohydrolase II n=1 Tax=Actinopolymorpha sp. NPDC004070 TaxID=3154548 RepID=UPI0033A5AF09